LVWADEQIERRKGTFTDYYGSILIRQEYQAVRDIKKYWYFKRQDVWVLEKLVFLPKESQMKDMLEELVHAQNGTYEPLYTFADINDNPLPVVHEVVDFVIWRTQNPMEKMTQKDVDKLEAAEDKREVQYFEEQLRQDERSPLFVWENSAFVSTEQIKFRKEMTYVEKSGPIELAN
jgi:hypothetical protein